MSPNLSKPVFGFGKALKLMKRGRKVVWMGATEDAYYTAEGRKFRITTRATSWLIDRIETGIILRTDWYEVDPPKFGRTKRPIRPGRTDKPAT